MLYSTFSPCRVGFRILLMGPLYRRAQKGVVRTIDSRGYCVGLQVLFTASACSLEMQGLCSSTFDDRVAGREATSRRRRKSRTCQALGPSRV